MKEDNFDQLIKQKLENISLEPLQEDAWSLFESNNPDFNDVGSNDDSEDAHFDQIIKHNLQQITSTYNADHWKLMKARLALRDERMANVISSKIMEIAAILLLVFTFANWNEWLEEGKVNDSLEYALETQYHSPRTSELNKQNLSETKQTKSLDQKLQGEIPNKAIADQKLLVFESENTKISNHINLINSATVNDATAADGVLDTKSTEEIDVAEVIKLLKHKESAETQNIAHTALRLPIQQSPYLPLAESAGPESEFAKIFPMYRTNPPAKPVIAMSMYASGDINLINTPFDKIYSRASYNKEALNNSYGINVSKKINNLELETGLGYAKREYQPDIFSEAFGQQENSYSEISLNKISYDIATIPFNLKYHFIDHPTWRSYVMVGAALNLVMNADYEIKEERIQGRPALENISRSEPRFDQKPFIDGLLSGESFSENYFASVGFGFGIEKNISKNVSLYVQPSYQRHILSSDLGIGPNKDRIHTSSLQFGVKSVLN